MSSSNPAWSMKVAVADVPETGRHFQIVADEATRAALAKELRLRALSRAEATFDVTRHGSDGMRVRGHLSATVGQDCVVTLEPMESEISEDIDLLFLPESKGGDVEDADARTAGDGEPPEPLRDGSVDLGAIATEFLVLSIDPYPRKGDVVFNSPVKDDPASHPFAALAALKDGKGGEKK